LCPDVDVAARERVRPSGVMCIARERE
jgi:hypothetical protein